MTPVSRRRDRTPAFDFAPLDVVRIVAARWPVLLVGAAVGVACAFVYTATATRLYRASMKMMVVPSQVVQQAEARTLDPSLAARYVPFLRNADVIERAIARVGFNKPEERWMLRRLDARLGTTLLKDAPVIELTLDFPDPERGKALVTAIAAEAIDLNRQMLTQSEEQNRKFLQDQLSAARSSLEGSEETLRQFQRRARLTDREAQLKALAKDRSRLEQLLVQREVRAAELDSTTSSLEKSLLAQPRLLNLRRAPADTGNAESKQVIQTEVVNPTYEKTEPLLLEQRSSLAGAKAAVEQVRRDVAAMERRIQGLSEAVAADKVTGESLQLQVDLGRSSYKSLFELHESARIAVTAQSADLKVFERPAVGYTPVFPRRGPAMLFGVAAGAALAVLVVLLATMFGMIAVPEYMRPVAEPAARELEEKSAAV